MVWQPNIYIYTSGGKNWLSRQSIIKQKWQGVIFWMIFFKLSNTIELRETQQVINVRNVKEKYVSNDCFGAAYLVMCIYNGILHCDRLFTPLFFGCIAILSLWFSFLAFSSVLCLSLNLILVSIIIIPVLSPALQFEFHLNVSYCLYSAPSIHLSLFRFGRFDTICTALPVCSELKLLFPFYFEFKKEWLLTAAKSKNKKLSKQADQQTV